MLYERNVAEEQGQLKGERYESMTMLWSLCSFNKEQIHGSKLGESRTSNEWPFSPQNNYTRAGTFAKGRTCSFKPRLLRINSFDSDSKSYPRTASREEGHECENERKKHCISCGILNPRSKPIQRWNQSLVISCAFGLAIDPLFFYLLIINEDQMCLHIDGKFSVLVTLLRTISDLMLLCNIWMQLKMAYVCKESLVVGQGMLVWDGQKIIQHYIYSRWILFDAFVILPIPQVAGSIWYLLGVQRVELCLERACKYIQDCDSSLLVCTPVIHYGKAPKYPTGNSPLSQDPTASSLCKSSNNFDFNYGIYLWAAPLVTTTNGLQRMIFPLFWGLMTLSSFGNALTPSNHMLEAAFSIIVIICGLLLFTMLIGNIQVFLQSITAKQQLMRFRFRDFEWWMKRRQLPIRLRRRVRDYERLRWAATRGIEEDAMVRDLPQGLRREVKGHLCLDLLRQVPLFGQMDQNMLDSICDQLKQFLFAKDEVIIREGEPVLRMLFILRGEVLAVYNAASIKQAAHQVRLKPGDFWGEELLSWCLHRPVINQLPLSSATLKCSDTAEAFGLEANDIMYVTQHLRSKFLSDMLAHSIRYYSINWRTWAVVTIQLAWRRCKVRRAGAEKVLAVASSQNVTAEYERSGAVVMVPKDVVKRSRILGASQKECLRLCTAIMNSPKPNSNCY
ncbi:hypothetical protein O6H91_12G072800 [Diphasiastrum complanatum]|uniref:Uncharacterized protein n=1 Tax=Diphasiastrum complanatum TaxID=34168 RepID=A0ACC2C3A8_DIPCM|nr:hypothetical protein O6H91_12G072800 [Diphasiastrum complanatum]